MMGKLSSKDNKGSQRQESAELRLEKERVKEKLQDLFCGELQGASKP
jgi:hypothetical protein